MNTQSHWLFLFYLYKKHIQDRHYFMCDMIFFMFKKLKNASATFVIIIISSLTI